MQTKTWRMWYERCDGCGEGTELYTDSNEQMVMDNRNLHGCMVRCRGCYCQGHIEYDFLGAYTQWPNDVCAKCYRDSDKRMEQFSRKLYQRLLIEHAVE